MVAAPTTDQGSFFPTRTQGALVGMLMQRAVYQIHGPESHHAPGISELDLKTTRRGDDGMHDAEFAIERRDARPDDLDGVSDGKGAEGGPVGGG